MSGHRNKKVKVWVRIRPTSDFAEDVIDLQTDKKTINIHCKRDDRKGVVNNQVLDWSFRTDGILHNASQDSVYSTIGQSLVTQALDGYNGTLMCYGQTGAGKTFTVTGATENYRQRGLIPRGLSQLYREIDDRSEYAINVRISYLEIYNETMFDLLSSLPESMASSYQGNMTVVEDENGVYVKGLSSHLAQTEEEALNLLFEGETNRTIATHSMNKQSSRSHCIFTVYLETRSRVQSTAKYTTSKLHFVDLAGSERLGKTQSTGTTQTEALYINKSLTFLEQTVIALADKRREHVPFRQTKLTHCLKDSIGGTCSTILVANVWGEETQIEETISTLRFASRMMCVANEPAINVYYDPAVMVKQLEKEIRFLRNELSMHDTLTNRSLVNYEPLSEQQKYEIRQQVRRYVDGGLDEVDIVNIRQIEGVFDSFKEICHQMETDIEERLRSKYTLIDKTDPAAIAAAQKAGVAIGDDGMLVGEPDIASGFGVGVAPRSARAEPSSVAAANKKQAIKKKMKERASPVGKGPASPSHSTKGEIASPQTPGGTDKKVTAVATEEREEVTTPTSSVPPETLKPVQHRPSTPPLRTDAYEEFKQKEGSEINRILNENKEILAAKKKSYSDLARQINHVKVNIDDCRDKLEQLRADRESQGHSYNEDGEAIISEDEFQQIKTLKELKQRYRSDYEELRQLKSEVQYCQRLVDQCRQRLIQEFDNWYAECYLTASDEPMTSAAMGVGVRVGTRLPTDGATNGLDDEQEKFDRLQAQLLLENPDSAAFYNARLRTDRRKTYEEATTQAQPHSKRKPGTPVIQNKTKPPTRLEVF